MLNIKLSNFLGKKHSVLTSSCSAAIYLLLKSLKLNNKKILIPANICFDVVLSIIYSNNKPLVIDTNKNLGFSLIDLKNELKFQKNIGAIIFPYLYGNSDNLKEIINLSKKKNILLIEDIAGAFGGKVGKKYFGSFSDFCVGSFGQGKIIDMSYGGFLSTNNFEVFKKANILKKNLKKYSYKSYKMYKQVNKVYDLILQKKISKRKFNSSELDKYFLGIVNERIFNKSFIKKLNFKINNIDKINSLRNKKAKYFEKLLKFKDFKSINHENGSVYWRKNFIIYQNSFDIISYLNRHKIYARKYYPPLNMIFPFINKKLNNSQKSYRKIINFWVSDETKLKDIKNINRLIHKYYNVNKTASTTS